MVELEKQNLVTMTETHLLDDDSYVENLADTADLDGSSQLGGDSRTLEDQNDSDNLSIGSDPTRPENQSRLIRGSKIIVLAVLFVAACLCGGATYTSAVESEKKDFEASFRERSQRLIGVSQSTAKNIFGSAKSLATTFTSYTRSNKAPWPFVTIPDYQMRNEYITQLSSANYFWLAPIVVPELRKEWEAWTVANLEDSELDDAQIAQVKPYIHRRKWDDPYTDFNWTAFPEDRPPEPYYVPIWQVAPILPMAINWNVLDFPALSDVVPATEKVRTPVYSRILLPTENGVGEWPQVHLVAPVFENFDDQSKVVALYGVELWWHKLIENVIPEGDITVVVHNTCDQAVSYLVQGPTVTYLGEGDQHDPEFTDYGISTRLDNVNVENSSTCSYTIHAYPTREFRDSFKTSNPILETAAVMLIFSVTSLVFVIYDCFMQRHQRKVASSAERSNAIVSSLFPAQVRSRLLEEKHDGVIQSNPSFQVNNLLPTAPIGSSGPAGLEREKAALLNSKPIADLFPNTTVLFADICNFTAWSSVREPSQVFMLLEQIYGTFDMIAKRRGIFKVETIGDCYVAVSGLPKPRTDHAECMAKFAHECRSRLRDVVQHLEVILGPDTADLTMRFGLHSGPVTAGVLRGEKSRFQLFGDTVNTASRIETTGENDRIHLSQDTAEILISHGMERWVKEREGCINIKGKGEMKTYWMAIPDNRERRAKNRSSSGNKAPSVISEAPDVIPDGVEMKPKISMDSEMKRKEIEKTNRLVDWNVDMLKLQLKKVVAMRGPISEKHRQSGESLKLDLNKPGLNVLDEVREIIALPSKTSEYRQDPNSIDLGQEVKDQLRNYVATIASLYHQNPFHSFEHASHVTQSVSKLLARVVTPDSIDYNDMCYKREQGEEQMHQYTYGITSDPLTHFACIFSALIHDVDHSGLPNATLVKERSEIAVLYRNKSVAEQNSVDLAWDLLMEPMYKDLRACIYSTQDELERFRQLVVNSVMATDIVDKELGSLRKKRWAKAFATKDATADGAPDNVEHAPESPLDDVNRKATIVIEHIIQASDVSHTMQHWHVYTKWNERLFEEMSKAYAAGRADKDPSEGWYEGELGFFDYYLIPLAKKLKECGVFGVASDEYLNYAVANRREWEQKGREIVEGYRSKFSKTDQQQQ